ncbi:MAG: 2-keto-4-pentenoate hydratase [Rhizobiaceae bacterium]
MLDLERLAAHIDQPGIDKDVGLDIIGLAPDLSLDDALRVQMGAKRLKVARGDAVVGWQASFTSAAVQKMVPSMPPPMVGTLLSSLMRPDGAVVGFDGDFTVIECEIGVVLKRDLVGPYVTPVQALAAVEAYFPAIEVAPVRPGLLDGKWSNQHIIAVQKAEGGFVVTGSHLTSPRNFDPRVEGVVVSVDGKARASAAGVETMGGPMNVLAAMANRLAAAGECMRAGQIAITGSLPPPQRVGADNVYAEAEFSHLGRVTVRFRD